MPRLLVVSARFYTDPRVVAAGVAGAGAYMQVAAWCADHQVSTFEAPWRLPFLITPEGQAGRAALKREELITDPPVYDSDFPTFVLITEGLVTLTPPPREGSRAAIPDEVRRAVLERDGGRCAICGETARLTVDHVWPWSLYGSDEPGNLRTLCGPCNSRRGARSLTR